MKIGFPYIVIILLVAIIIWLSKCSGDTIVTDIDTLVKVSYIHDTLRIKGKTRIKPISEIHWVHDTIIDSTGNIIITETEKYITNDTFEYKTDSFTAIFYSRIYSPSPLDSIQTSLLANIRHKIIEKTITKEIIRKHAFFAGPSVSLSFDYFSLDGLYERNGKIIYKVGVGVNNKSQPSINAGVYFQLFK